MSGNEGRDADYKDPPGSAKPDRKKNSKRPQAPVKPQGAEILMMAYLDGELGPEEKKSFESTLESHPEWREQMKEMAVVMGVADRLRFKPVREEFWDGFYEEIEPRLWEKPVGLIIMATGVILVLLFAALSLIMLFENIIWQAGSALILFGLITVFVAVLRGKIMEYQKDRYRKVRR